MRILLLFALVACGAQIRTTTPDTFVRMERTGCQGMPCRVYTLTLYADGAVHYEGVFNVPAGAKWRTIAPGRVENLMGEAERVTAWTCDPDRIRRELPGAIVTVSRAGKVTRRYEHNDGDPCAPHETFAVEGAIDVDAGLSRFLEK
ncbi:MAG TPA: DUF6438 domain-containing protein [Kofleriaceae bacterium]